MGTGFKTTSRGLVTVTHVSTRNTTAGLPPTLAELATAPVGQRRRTRGWLVGTGAIVALVLAGWLADIRIDSSIHDKVQQRVERAISDGMQAAVAAAPLRYMGTAQGNYYVPDIFRSQTMTLCEASAVWDDALQELNQDLSAPLVSVSLPSIWPGPALDAANVLVTVRYAEWLGREASDIFTVSVPLPHYTNPHKTPGFPGPVECSGL